MNEPEEITSLKGNSIPRKISVDYISFSAHVDYSQNSEFIEQVKAQHVVGDDHGRSHVGNIDRFTIPLGARSRRADCHGPFACCHDGSVQRS
jgi:hypothetical protein